MRFGLIACEVLKKEIESLQPRSVAWKLFLPQGLHDTPDVLRRRVQEGVAAAERCGQALDAILLGYGLCGGGMCGISAQRLPLVLPRSDDCIGILLGSQRRYRALFDEGEGVYWFSPGWIDYANLPTDAYYAAMSDAYISRFGEDNARYLMELETGWIKNYRRGIYIDSLPDEKARYCPVAKEIAGNCGWEFMSVPGELEMLSSMLCGEWQKENFFVCPPGKTIAASYDETKFTAQ